MQKKIALIAIGGNALLQEKQRGLQEEQLENANQTAAGTLKYYTGSDGHIGAETNPHIRANVHR